MRKLMLAAACTSTTILLSANTQFAAPEPLPVISQVFSIEKEIAPGGKAVVNVKVTNGGRSVFMLNTTGLPSQPVCAGYRITVLRHPIASAPDNGVFANMCILNGQFQQMPIAPGATYLQEIELSQYINPQTKGDYSIEISHPLTRSENPSDSRTTLNFRVD